jgi:predicted ribosome quality control (RQC) complex YloA/Tae2 family protein
MSCASAVAIWEAEGKGEVRKCPKCRSSLSPFFPDKEEEKIEIPAVPPMQTMRALLLQALMGSSLDPFIQALDRFGNKIELLTAEMKTRNKIEEAKIIYNKALDEARAGIKAMLKTQEKERRNAAEEGQGTDNS